MLSALVLKIKKADVETCLLTVGEKTLKKNKKRKGCALVILVAIYKAFQMHWRLNAP